VAETAKCSSNYAKKAQSTLSFITIVLKEAKSSVRKVSKKEIKKVYSLCDSIASLPSFIFMQLVDPLRPLRILSEVLLHLCGFCL